jgi:osmoprotectant transport system ATP-binding protein
VIQQVGLFPHQTVAQNVATVPRLLGWDRRRANERVDELLALVDLEPSAYRDRYPHELSGGQAQRVGVARALAADPPVLLMDEPFGALDPIIRDRLQDEFRRLQAELRKTVVFVTHDLDEAVKMGDRIAVMAVGGRLEQYASPAEILAHPATSFVGSFVGEDRGLKRLGVVALKEGDARSWPTVDAERAARVGLGPARAVVDGDGRFRGFADGDGGGSRDADARVRVGDSLRDALAALLLEGREVVALVDADDVYCGVITVTDVLVAAGRLPSAG